LLHKGSLVSRKALLPLSHEQEALPSLWSLAASLHLPLPSLSHPPIAFFPTFLQQSPHATQRGLFSVLHSWTFSL
jgi:hypothetical protein